MRTPLDTVWRRTCVLWLNARAAPVHTPGMPCRPARDSRRRDSRTSRAPRSLPPRRSCSRKATCPPRPRRSCGSSDSTSPSTATPSRSARPAPPNAGSRGGRVYILTRIGPSWVQEAVLIAAARGARRSHHAEVRIRPRHQRRHHRRRLHGQRARLRRRERRVRLPARQQRLAVGGDAQGRRCVRDIGVRARRRDRRRHDPRRRAVLLPPAPAPRGSAYVFTRTGTTWTKQAELRTNDPDSRNLGFTVALEGDTAIVGSPVGTGVAHVFTRTGGTWTEQAKLTAPDARDGDQFAMNIALDGDTAVLGAVRAAGIGGMTEGAAYVFVRTGAAWTFQAKLIRERRRHQAVRRGRRDRWRRGARRLPRMLRTHGLQSRLGLPLSPSRRDLDADAETRRSTPLAVCRLRRGRRAGERHRDRHRALCGRGDRTRARARRSAAAASRLRTIHAARRSSVRGRLRHLRSRQPVGAAGRHRHILESGAAAGFGAGDRPSRQQPHHADRPRSRRTPPARRRSPSPHPTASSAPRARCN